MRHELAGVLEREGLHVHNLGGEASGPDRRLALLDVLAARGDQQHVVGIGIPLVGSQHLEVVAHFIHRKGDVLVGLHLDLRLEVAAAQCARHLDHLGDRGIAGNCHRHLAALGAGALHRAADRLPDCLGIHDRLLVDGVLGGGLGGVGLDTVLATPHGELDELHRGGRYVKSQEWAVFAL